MALEFMPRYSPDWVFFEQSSQQVIEIVRIIGELLDRLLCDHLEDALERALVKGHLSCSHLVHDDAERPEV